MHKLTIAYLILLTIVSNLYAQHSIEQTIHLQNKGQVDSLLSKLILKDYYEDPKKEMKVLFALKVDSLGEIHSAHIIWSINLLQEKHYDICKKIEKYLNARFLYYVRDGILSKYSHCSYPFFAK